MRRDDVEAAERCTMTELRYDAPLATFDGDEWTEFLDDEDDADQGDTGRRSSDVQFAERGPRSLSGGGDVDPNGAGCPAKPDSAGDGFVDLDVPETPAPSKPDSSEGVTGFGDPDGPGCSAKPDPAGDGGFGDDTFSGSLEDLVSCFDENVRRCFRNYSEDTDFIAPVQIRTQAQVLHESQ